MKHTPMQRLLCLFYLCLIALPVLAQTEAPGGKPANAVRHLDVDYSNQLPAYTSKEAWLERAAVLRNQILASAGLSPMPEKTPLNAVIFGKVDRGDYTVEKVYFESLPGHFVSGNLYRPKNFVGKAPAVLCPHGHWAYGRFENTPTNSGPSRAASFAQQGYVSFMWDMVGYGDSTAIPHTFNNGHREGLTRETLWGVNLLGLQLWNSMRAADFLLSLSEVDSTRLAITGESGGGTQTFLLAAIDNRISFAAPVNMVSALMQGGSVCENAPNLRIDTTNVEIAALFAPRPMLLIAATGDWTRNVPNVEFPAIRRIYQLFGAENKVQVVQIEAPHNYNQASREAVYGWFAHWMQNRTETTPLKERGITVAPLSDLMVFHSRMRPTGEVNESQLTEVMIWAAKRQALLNQPKDTASLQKYQELYGPALQGALLASMPRAEQLQVSADKADEFSIAAKPGVESIRVKVNPGSNASAKVVLLVESTPNAALASALTEQGYAVLQLTQFTAPQPEAPPNIKFYTTYNRTTAARRVQDVLTAIAFARQQAKGQTVSLIATGEAGLWAWLARGLAGDLERTVIDVNQFANNDENAWLAKAPIPSLRRAGDLTTATALAGPKPLLLFNVGEQFDTAAISNIYKVSNQEKALRVERPTMSAADISAWLNQ